MGSVLMALVITWWCPLMLLPVILGQLSQDDWHQRLGVIDRYAVFYPLIESKSQPRLRVARAVRSKKLMPDDLTDVEELEALQINAPGIFQERLHLRLNSALEFISPEFVVQRVSGSRTWLEEAGQDLDCFYSGYVLGHQESAVTLAICDGMRGVLHFRGERYFIEPIRNSTSLPLHQRLHVIYQKPSQNQSLPNCHSIENFKHHRLKNKRSFIRKRLISSVSRDVRFNFSQQILHKQSPGISQKHTRHKRSTEQSGKHTRYKRSPGVSRKHRVETLVVADSAMYEYHGADLQQYVLTLMSIVRNIYRDPSLQNYISVIVVKLIIFHTKEDMPLNVSYNAATTLREFCKWQYEVNSHGQNSVLHHDTAILITREDICRAPGKCDTLGLAELGTICDPFRSCSVIEDNGLSSAFTIAHELGHVFNLPHDDDDNRCKVYQDLGQTARQYHVMAPTLDANSSPWDWSACSAHLMTEFIDAGLAECLRDAVKAKDLNHKVKRPGWLYNADRQCEFVFGTGYGLCPYMNTPTCARLWCTNKTDSPNSGCRTQHMPWADGTQCGDKKMCQKGQCILISTKDLKPINGGWSAWTKYSLCSRSCGGGVQTKLRTCDDPIPQNGGRYCLGRRFHYKSCNTQACPAVSTDFRAEQCEKFNGKSMNNLPPHTKWVPKYSGIHMKDACKLYCRASSSSAYYLLAKTVIDGTKCGPFTDDICVNGHCRPAGCDNKLASKKKRDHCGVCGGDNHTCQTVTGAFNNAIYGYNYITTIPSGATQIDIHQHGQKYLSDDDNYLALQNSEKKYILNGDFIVRTERWRVRLNSGMLEYSGSDEIVERINSTRMIGETVNVYVLSVGKLFPPNVTYSYVISSGDNVQFKWSNMGSWRKCSHTCRGKRKRRIVCVHGDNNLIVSKKRCKGKNMKKPSYIEEPCNTDCKLEWRVFNKELCPVRCGVGMQRQLVHCVKQTGFSQIDIMQDRECRRVLGAKPHEFVPCSGKCLPTFWSYTEWSHCSLTCGNGTKSRQAKCVDEEGEEVDDRECETKELVTSQKCNTHSCPMWQTGEWLGCSATCGTGKKLRKVWCMQGNQKMDDNFCDKKLKPTPKKSCHLKQCPEWYPGGWGPCSVTCGRGVSMRAVKCRVSTTLVEDTFCDATSQPEDTRSCFMENCPASLSLTTTASLSPQAAFWRFGSWTECSVTCGPGTRHRFVSCMGYHGQTLNTSLCAQLQRPSSNESCMTKPCGDWRSGGWSDCTVTCGQGIQTRYVKCMFNEQITDDSLCDMVDKPHAETRCNRGTCISPDERDFNVSVITSNRVEGSSRWLTWEWTPCSVTCGPGWQQRHVVCYDERGEADTCDKELKPDEFQHCDGGHCPIWGVAQWSECSAKTCDEEGLQNRLVYCRLGDTDILPNSKCDTQQRPPDTRACQAPCTSLSYRWKVGLWSSCSVTCGRGLKHREINCLDQMNNFISYSLCKSPKPHNTKRCLAGHCPKWHRGRWSKCSVTCGRGVRIREVVCRKSPNEIVSTTLCSKENRPKHSSVCVHKDCSLYVWSTGQWSECSKTCGFGQKHRPVTCVNKQGLDVSYHLCDEKKKPKIRRRCSEFPCPYIWSTGPWSQCSATCGEGQQMRTVLCQAVTKEGWILPGEARDSCKLEERPSFARYCNYGDCRAKYHWSVGPWDSCTAKCGSGQERRRVVCVNTQSEHVPSGMCLRLYRPPQRRSCYSGPCYARSCKELKELSTIRKDGDYQIQIENELVTVYCKDMQKSTPTEYLTLPTGEEANFAEVFGKRLRRHATCPYNKTKPVTCDLCRSKTYKQAGNTTFSKIRIDPVTLRLHVNDKSFSHVHSGKFIPFGTAGDCYSSKGCPQGQFSINLLGTRFIVSINTTWALQGNEATQQIWRLRDGQIIRGLCGGYCGVCSPDHVTGLQLELLK